jgi:hypothetical protein
MIATHSALSRHDHRLKQQQQQQQKKKKNKQTNKQTKPNVKKPIATHDEELICFCLAYEPAACKAAMSFGRAEPSSVRTSHDDFDSVFIFLRLYLSKTAAMLLVKSRRARAAGAARRSTPLARDSSAMRCETWGIRFSRFGFR